MSNCANSIGSGWPDMSKRSELPTSEERAKQEREMAAGLPPVRYKVLVRYERIFGVWSVTMSEDGLVLRECRIADDDMLEKMIERGRGMGCLADRQAVEAGIRRGLGMIYVFLDAVQYANLQHPR